MQGDWVQDCGMVADSLNSFGTVPCTFPPNMKNRGYFSLTDHVVMPDFPT